MRIYVVGQNTKHLRNKFHFSEVHGSMNATGHVQSLRDARVTCKVYVTPEEGVT